MTMNRLSLRGIVVSFFLCLTGSLAFGQNNRTWVSGSSTAMDSGSCSRTAPCKTFAFALSVTNAGGEIDALDSGDFGPVTINKSVSIVADGVVAGIQVTSSDAIDVTGSGVTVVLRGLTLDGSGAPFTGIFFTGSGALHIEGCTMNNFTGDGIEIAPSGQSQVFIKDTIVRNNALGILFQPSGSGVAIATLDNVRIEHNTDGGVLVQGNATVSVRNSVAAGNGTGFFTSVTGGLTVINLESTIASGNGTGIDSEGANSTINITNVTVVDNGTGLSTASGGHAVSFGNNKITNNTTNGSPTKTIAQK